MEAATRIMWSLEQIVALFERARAMFRYSEIAILAALLALIVWLDIPRLIAPAFVLTVGLLSAYRWYRGIWPWPPRRRSN
jgi:uncharacterized membrane protein